MRQKISNVIEGGRILSQYLTFTTTAIVPLMALVLQIQFCTCRDSFTDYYEVSTESPDMVEWINTTPSTPPQHLQIQIKALSVETQVKLRYARTRIKINLRNPYDKELQAQFKIILPENAFFTVLQLKAGANPKTYAAEIVKRKVARNIFHFARTKTEETVSAGYIEISPDTMDGLSCYNLKFTVSAQESVQSFLVYERQLIRVSDEYTDRIQVFPIDPLVNSTLIGAVEFKVNVEELEGIQSLHCTNATLKNFPKCSSTIRNKRLRQGQRYRSVELTWREKNVTAHRLEQQPFQFTYELEQQNETTSAVVISQHNGNFYFVHLFVPKNLPQVRKHIIFLLDISDSMYGIKLEQLQWSMKEILDDLQNDDFFNIIAFSNDITMWSKFRGDRRKCPVPFPATEESKESAATFIESKLIAHGTTNIYLGLSTAFDLVRLFSPETDDKCENATSINTPKALRMKEQMLEKLPPEVEPMIFFLSDGRATSGPTDSKSLLKYFSELNQESSRNGKLSVQIHTIAYGEDADVDFLKTLASLNKGTTKVIREESAAGIELADFYQEVTSQVLSNVQTSVVVNDTTQQSSEIILSSPVTVIRGSEVLTAGQLFFQNGSSPFLTANATALNWSTEAVGKSGKLAYYNSPIYDCRNLKVTMGKCVQRIDYYLERLQAYQLLQKLLERDHLVQQGYICPRNYHDTFQDLKMEQMKQYEDDDYNSDESRMNCYNIFQQQVTELALKHRFVTPYTSFILTTEQVDNGLREKEVIAGASSSEEDSAENVNNTRSVQKSEKLILLGPVSSLEAEPTSLGPQFQIQTELLEVIPTTSKIVYPEDNSEKNKDVTTIGFTNATTASNINTANPNSGLRLFAKSMRDFMGKTFRRFFRLPKQTSEKPQQITVNLTKVTS